MKEDGYHTHQVVVSSCNKRELCIGRCLMSYSMLLKVKCDKNRKLIGDSHKDNIRNVKKQSKWLELTDFNEI